MRLIDADACREDFMQEVYAELESDPDNVRANRIIDLFDMMPTIESPRDWTPCAEGMPTKEQAMVVNSYRHFHVTITDSTGKRSDAVEDCAWRNEEWYMFEYNCNILKTEWVAVAWKAYPTPYRADDTTGKVKEDA